MAHQEPDWFDRTEISEEQPEHSEKAKTDQGHLSQDIRRQPGFPQSTRGAARFGRGYGNKKKRQKPTHHVAIQIKDPKILGVARKVQADILNNSTVNLSHGVMAVKEGHVTLWVTNLSTPEEIQKAGECLERCVPAIQEAIGGGPVTLNFKGVSQFDDGKVVFACLEPTKGLDDLHFMASQFVLY